MPLAPVWLDPLMKRIGLNPYGQPFYRVVWSEDRMETFYGKLQPKYAGEAKDRWILEKWLPWEDYGEWDEAAYGARPMGGEYDISQVIEIEGQFVSLETFGAETLTLLIACIERGKLLSKSEKLRAKQEKQRKSEAEAKQRFSDIYDECQGPFGENAVSGIPSKRRPDDVKLYGPNDLPKALRRKLARRPGEIKQV